MTAARDAMLAAGAKVALEHGLVGLTVDKVVADLEQSKGSFSGTFRTMDNFVLALAEREIDLYRRRELASLTEARSTGPLANLRTFISMNSTGLTQQQAKQGFLLANFLGEGGYSRYELQTRVRGFLDEVEATLTTTLKASVQRDYVRLPMEPPVVAAAMVESMIGARLSAKARASQAPLERFKDFAIKRLLNQTM